MKQSIVCRKSICLLAMTMLLVLNPSSTVAHDGEMRAPHDLLGVWQPMVLLVIGLVAVPYARGIRLLWRRSGVGRGVRRWQVGSFALGMAALIIALASPLHVLSEALLSAHMAQHLLLIVVAAPLLILGAPHTALLWAAPQRWRPVIMRLLRRRPLSAAFSVLTRPAVATIVHLCALLVWHVPSLYEAALHNEFLHLLEHGSFWLTALLWWWALVAPHGRLHYGSGIFAVFATAMISSVLGVFMALAPRLWYPLYAKRTVALGLIPLDDQQLAGVLMWMPPGVVYLVAAGALLVAWLRAVERRVQQREQRLHQTPASVLVNEGDVAV